MCFQERKIAYLLRDMDRAWKELNQHRHPRCALTEAEEDAWLLEHQALALRFEAACRRYNAAAAEVELHRGLERFNAES